MATTWRVYGPETLAYRLDRAELPGFIMGKHITIGPGEGAIVIRDGQPQELVTQARLKIQGFWEGLSNGLLGWLKGTHDVQVIFIDLCPIRIPVFLGSLQKEEQTRATVSVADGWQSATNLSQVSILAMTADKQIISAECVLTLQVDTSNLQGVLGLMRSSSTATAPTPPPVPGSKSSPAQGRRALSRLELAGVIRDELLARVLIPHISSHNAAELRGNRDLASSIASWARVELAQPLAAWGLSMVNFTINWGLTEEEAFEVARRRVELEEEARKFKQTMVLAQMARELEIKKAEIDNRQQLRLAETSNDEQLRDICLSGVLRREALTDGKRVSIVKIDAEVRGIQLEVQKLESNLRLETRRAEETLRLDTEDRSWRQKNDSRLASIDAEDKEMRNLVAAQIQMATAKHEREMATRRQDADVEYRRLQNEIEARYQERQVRLQEDLARMEQTKAIMTAGLSSGAVTSEVMSTFLTESTRQSFGTTTDAKAAALFESEKGKNEMGVFRSAEDRERQHQQETTRLAANLMQASKQTPGPAIITGLGAAPPSSGVNVVSLPAGGTPSATPQLSGPALAAGDVASRLAKLKGLHQQGLIDDDEYKQRKSAILAEV